MFFKQYNYKPRSNSQSSQGSASGSAIKEESKTTTDTKAPAAGTAAAARRRSSASGDKFAGLTGQKRNSQDERKASWTEQKPGQPGILGGIWQNFTKGT